MQYIIVDDFLSQKELNEALNFCKTLKFFQAPHQVQRIMSIDADFMSSLNSKDERTRLGQAFKQHDQRNGLNKWTEINKSKLSKFLKANKEQANAQLYLYRLFDEYQKTIYDFLFQLLPKQYNVPTTRMYMSLASAGYGYKYPPHIDLYVKILSVVVYLNDENQGTILCDKDGNEIEEIEWKKNRAFIFLNNDANGYHKYISNNKNENRYTLNFNIKTPPKRPLVDPLPVLNDIFINI